MNDVRCGPFFIFIIQFLMHLYTAIGSYELFNRFREANILVDTTGQFLLDIFPSVLLGYEKKVKNYSHEDSNGALLCGKLGKLV